MKVVLDTNIIISAIVFGGKPRIIFELIIIEKILQGVTSKFLLNELLRILESKFKFSQSRIIYVRGLIEENFVILDPKDIPNIIQDDPEDNHVLALQSKVDYIISGDNHLLKIKNYKNTPIVNPEEFFEIGLVK